MTGLIAQIIHYPVNTVKRKLLWRHRVSIISSREKSCLYFHSTSISRTVLKKVIHGFVTAQVFWSQYCFLKDCVKSMMVTNTFYFYDYFKTCAV